MKQSVFVIAEAGVNHNGSLKVAKKMIDLAKETGADAIKFQTFTAESSISRTAEKASYQKLNSNNRTETQFDMVKKIRIKQVRPYRTYKSLQKSWYHFYVISF